MPNRDGRKKRRKCWVCAAISLSWKLVAWPYIVRGASLTTTMVVFDNSAESQQYKDRAQKTVDLMVKQSEDAQRSRATLEADMQVLQSKNLTLRMDCSDLREVSTTVPSMKGLISILLQKANDQLTARVDNLRADLDAADDRFKNFQTFAEKRIDEYAAAYAGNV